MWYDDIPPFFSLKTLPFLYFAFEIPIGWIWFDELDAVLVRRHAADDRVGSPRKANRAAMLGGHSRRQSSQHGRAGATMEPGPEPGALPPAPPATPKATPQRRTRSPAHSGRVFSRKNVFYKHGIFIPEEPYSSWQVAVHFGLNTQT